MSQGRLELGWGTAPGRPGSRKPMGRPAWPPRVCSGPFGGVSSWYAEHVAFQPFPLGTPPAKSKAWCLWGTPGVGVALWCLHLSNGKVLLPRPVPNTHFPAAAQVASPPSFSSCTPFLPLLGWLSFPLPSVSLLTLPPPARNSPAPRLPCPPGLQAPAFAHCFHSHPLGGDRGWVVARIWWWVTFRLVPLPQVP